MIDPLILVIFSSLALALSSLSAHRHASAILLIGGAAFLCIFAPSSALIIAAISTFAGLLIILLKDRPRKDKLRKYGPYAILPSLLLVDFNQVLVGFPLSTIGVSFAIIRIFMTAKQSLGSRKGAQISDIYWVFVAGFYLPALPVGPVFSGLDLEKQRPAQRGAGVSQHIRLIFMGLIFVSLLAPAIALRVTSLYDGPLQTYVLVPTLLFLQLFLAFWGQSLIAENFGAMFGHKVPINFNEPWKAKDIRDFWSRWHRSMADFVMAYIFLPLQVNGVNPKVATVAAFVFMGLWHNVSLGYFLWGLGHGLLLANWPRIETGAGRRLIGLAQRVVLWIAVISLSYLANFAHIEKYL